MIENSTIPSNSLYKGREIYVIERNPDNPTYYTGKIVGIVKSNDRHYLRVKINEDTGEIIRVQISGTILPDELLNNSIFFYKEDVLQVLTLYKEYLFRHIRNKRS